MSIETRKFKLKELKTKKLCKTKKMNFLLVKINTVAIILFCVKRARRGVKTP
jgi:hypothetical protein